MSREKIIYNIDRVPIRLTHEDSERATFSFYFKTEYTRADNEHTRDCIVEALSDIRAGQTVEFDYVWLASRTSQDCFSQVWFWLFDGTATDNNYLRNTVSTMTFLYYGNEDASHAAFGTDWNPLSFLFTGPEAPTGMHYDVRKYHISISVRAAQGGTDFLYTVTEADRGFHNSYCTTVHSDRAIPNGLRLVFSSNRTAYGISNLSVNHKTVSLPCLDAPTAAAQDFVVFNDSSCRTVHFHEQIEILQVRSGCMSCTVNGADLTLSQGQTLLINSNIPHRIKSQTENSEVTVLDFDIYDWIAQSDMENAQYPYSFLSRHTTVPYRIWNSTDAEELISHIYRIAEETEAKRPAYRMFVKSYITWIAAYLWRENFLTDIDLGKKPELNRVLPAIRFIDEHYHQPLTLDQISRAVLLDRSYLCKLFKRATDTTLTDYINYVRVRRAAEMLRTTDRSSMEIAYACGFASQQYFNRIFKREFGQTPKAFRISQRID